MPVIGRLNEQVEEVIIKPVGRRHAPDGTDAPAPPASIPARDEPREIQHAERSETSRDERRGKGELPVWLL